MQSMPVSLLLYSWLLSHFPFVYPSSRLYNELRLLGGACPPRDTCSTLHSIEDDHLWSNRTCECGSHCVRRNTCCIDSPHAGRFYVHPPEDETCQKVPTTKFSVRMVSNCSRREQHNRYLLQKCSQLGDDDFTDPLMATPVTSWKSETTYRNYFCALCNDDAEHGVLWDIDVQGLPPEEVVEDDVVDRLVFDDAGGSWGVLSKHKGSIQKVKLMFTVPARLRKIVKKCYPTLVNGCHESQENTMLHHKCLAYYAPVKLKQGEWRIKFRNVHCGLCNDARAEGDEDDVCKLETTKKKSKPKVNFALLLDVNTENGGLVGRIEKCEEGQMFDPFFKKCRTLKCILPNYVLKNRKCVKEE